MKNLRNAEAVMERLQAVERRQRNWGRLAIALSAVALLAFAGWAPLDDLDFAVPETTPAKQPIRPSAAETAEAVLDVVSPTPDADSQPAATNSVLIDGSSGFQSYTHREGDEPYIPSRMDWLSLRASAELPRGGTPSDGYGILYGPDGKGSNTIRVLCTYDSKQVNRERMEADLKYSQMQLEGLAKLYGWDWMKVRVETRAIN